MAPGSLERIAEQLSTQPRTTGSTPERPFSLDPEHPFDKQTQVCGDSTECYTRAKATSFAAGLIGLSAGFAAQVSLRRAIPRILRATMALPLGLSVASSIGVYHRLQHRCQQIQQTCQQQLMEDGPHYILDTDAERNLGS